MELEELDRLLFCKWSPAEVVFSVLQLWVLSLLSCNGLIASAFQKKF